VVRFQRRHGLEPDGVLGRRTQAALAVPIDWRVRQIEMALERLRWLPDLGPSPLIVVNIPMFRLWAWDAVSRAPALSMNVVVGRALNRQTPVFMAEMPSIIFRPYWNVPVSIARAEFLPALARDPDRLAREHLEVVGGGAEAHVLPPSAEALAQVQRGSLRLRQRPGPANALGLLKFVFLNEHDVYMHGTPAQTLFARSRRDFSHGCIRVEDPVALAEWVLGDASTWPRAQVEAATLGADDRRVALPRPVQVLLFYVTAVVTPEDDWVHFADDIYGHDARLDKALALSYKNPSSSAPGRSQ
jgi:murein L,D-transpeptidase YcbB/YkuD